MAQEKNPLYTRVHAALVSQSAHDLTKAFDACRDELTADNVVAFLCDEPGSETAATTLPREDLDIALYRSLAEMGKRHNGKITSRANGQEFEMSVYDILTLVDEKLTIRGREVRRRQMKKSGSHGAAKDKTVYASRVLEFTLRKGRNTIGHCLLKTGLWRVLRLMVEFNPHDKHLVRQSVRASLTQRTALHSLANSRLPTKDEYIAAFKFLEEIGSIPTPYQTLVGKQTPLLIAMKQINPTAVEAYISYFPAMVHMRDSVDRTPLLELFYLVRKMGLTADYRTMGGMLLAAGADRFAVDSSNRTIKDLCEETGKALLDFSRFIEAKMRALRNKEISEAAYERWRDLYETGNGCGTAGCSAASSKKFGVASLRPLKMPLGIAFGAKYAQIVPGTLTAEERFEAMNKRHDEAVERFEKERLARQEQEGSEASTSSASVATKDAADTEEELFPSVMDTSVEVESGADGLYNAPLDEDEMRVEIELSDTSPQARDIELRTTGMPLQDGKTAVYNMHFACTAGKFLPPAQLQVHLTLAESPVTAMERFLKLQETAAGCGDEECSEPSETTALVEENAPKEKSSLRNKVLENLKRSTQTEQERVDAESPELEGLQIEIDWSSVVLACGHYNRYVKQDLMRMEGVRVMVEPIENASEAELEYYRQRNLCMDQMNKFQRVHISREYSDKYDIDIMYDVRVTPIKSVVTDPDAQVRHAIRTALEPKVAEAALVKAGDSGAEANLSESVEPGTREALMELIGSDMEALRDAFPNSSEEDTQRPVAYVWQFVPHLDLTVSVRCKE